jgi:hypothetical protein
MPYRSALPQPKIPANGAADALAPALAAQSSVLSCREPAGPRLQARATPCRAAPAQTCVGVLFWVEIAGALCLGEVRPRATRRLPLRVDAAA